MEELLKDLSESSIPTGLGGTMEMRNDPFEFDLSDSGIFRRNEGNNKKATTISTASGSVAVDQVDLTIEGVHP